MSRTYLRFLAVVLILVSAAYPQSVISVRGSDAMILFGQKCSALYGSQHAEVKINVTGGGAENGMNAIAAHTADIVQLTQDVSAAARQRVETKSGRLVQIPVGIEAVAVFVQRSNPINELTVAQLRDIYTGKISNWREVGGRDQPIQLYSTESAVGGSLFFGEIVLNGQDFDTTMRGFNNSQETWRAVAADPKGIGFGGFLASGDAKLLRISKAKGSSAIAATLDNVRNTTFPLSRRLFWLLRPGASGVRELALWTVSSQGQLVVESVGYYPLSPGDRHTAATTVTGTNGN